MYVKAERDLLLLLQQPVHVRGLELRLSVRCICVCWHGACVTSHFVQAGMLLLVSSCSCCAL